MIYSSHDNQSKIKGFLDKFRDDKLSVVELKELLERTYKLLKDASDDSEKYNLGLSVICHVASIDIEDLLLQKLLDDCIEQSRVFLYKDMVGRRRNEDPDKLSSFYASISKEFYTLELTNTVLTRDQKRLFDLFQNKRRIIVSAPTSFGKSRIVQEIISHNDYKNILIVLPTIALLNETFVRLKENDDISEKYHLYNSLGKGDTAFNDEGNIFILTPEKTDLLLDQNLNIRFDFFTMDEIYKIQDDDGRGKVFTNCLYRLSRIPGIHFYLIGPYFSGFSKAFVSKTRSEFAIYESEIVQKDQFDISKLEVGNTFTINGKEITKRKGINSNLRNLYKALNGQSLIYRGQQKRSAETIAKFLIPYTKSKSEIELIAYIEENVAKDWTLVECLKSGVAFHHGALPKYIQTEIIEAFNDGDLETIVCTSTIVEGVNTTAKNVIIYDEFKGPYELTGFDVKNIKGRAGRFLVHFVGNIYTLVKLTEDSNKGEIEFSFYDRDDLDPEDTIQIEKEDLSGNNLKNREKTEALLEKYKIPISVIKSNKFIPIHKQISLILELRSNPRLLEEIHFSKNLPTRDQLDGMLSLCHQFLFNERDLNDRNYTIGQLSRLTKFYIYKQPSLKEIIAEHNKSKNIDTRVRQAFNLISHYFEFAIPKYLTAFENIFNFVYLERNKGRKEISLTYLITILEFGHALEHEIAMKEAGLPNEIIKKVADNFKDCNTLQEVRLKYALNPGVISGLTDFERKIFKRYI